MSSIDRCRRSAERVEDHSSIKEPARRFGVESGAKVDKPHCMEAPGTSSEAMRIVILKDRDFDQLNMALTVHGGGDWLKSIDPERDLDETLKTIGLLAQMADKRLNELNRHNVCDSCGHGVRTPESDSAAKLSGIVSRIKAIRLKLNMEE